MNKFLSIFGLILLLLSGGCSADKKAARQERRAIKAGNTLYEQGRYAEASEKYKEAIEYNPNSMEGLYNLSLASLKRAETVESDSLKQQLTGMGMQGLATVAQTASSNPTLASKASYNLGNISFEGKKFPDAIMSYKQSLRLIPNDENARRNLRIAQLQQNDDQNQDQNQDQNEDKKEDQNKDQNQNQDENQNQDKEQDQKEHEQQQPRINEQSAEQILQSIDNRENQVRARMMQGQEASSRKSNNRKW